MKLKILAIVALGRGRHRGRVRRARWPAGQCVRHHPVPDRSGHHRRRQRRRRRDGHPGRDRASYGVSFGSPARVAGATASSGTATWTAQSVKVAAGDAVKKGQVLATADTADLRRQLAECDDRAEDGQHPARDRQGRTGRRATTTAAIRQARIGVYNAETQVSSARRRGTTWPTRSSSRRSRRRSTGSSRRSISSPVSSAPTGDAIVVDSTTLQVTADVVESDVATI